MRPDSTELTIDELRARMKAAGVKIAESRLEMVQKLVSQALAPVREADWRAGETVEPAATFDAGVPSTRRADEGAGDGGR